MDVHVSTALDDDELAVVDRLYRDSFGDLAHRAAARHLLTAGEFAAEMRDTRVEKYLAVTDGRTVGLSTLTDDLDAVPWISPQFYAERYPEHHARGAILYFGLTLVHPDFQRSTALLRMLQAMCGRAERLGAVVGYDICAYNNDVHDFARATSRVMADMARTSVEQVDVQTYYAMTFTSPDAATSPGAGLPSR